MINQYSFAEVPLVPLLRSDSYTALPVPHDSLDVVIAQRCAGTREMMESLCILIHLEPWHRIFFGGYGSNVLWDTLRV
jgi:hypothetical protein